MRRPGVGAALTLACLLAVGACSGAPGGEDPDARELEPGVLAAEDLPAEPSSTEVVDTLPDLTPECGTTLGPPWGADDLDSQIVEYQLDGMTVASAASTPNEKFLDSDELAGNLTAFEHELSRCPSARPEKERPEWEEQFPDLGWSRPVDGLGQGRFGYRMLDHDRQFIGTEGYAVAGDTVVEVAIYPDTPGEEPDADLRELLDAAIARAES